MKKAIVLLLLLLAATTFQSCALLTAAGISSQGQPIKQVQGTLISTLEDSEVNVDHSDWNSLLQKHVDDMGFVDYKGFQKDRNDLKKYLNYLSNFKPNTRWSVQELLAYYINLYNAYTVQLIVENYPIQSIKDINGPWTKAIVPVSNKVLSLGGIENGVLRKMNEPRIHFAINCASISCPKLLNEAYTASEINEQLDSVSLDFINGEKNDITANTVRLSSIFDWYKKDFLVDGKQDVIGYINTYSEEKIQPNTPIEFKNYDWNLNEQQ